LIKEFTFDDYLYEIKSRDTTENKENLQIQVNDNFLSFRELSEENYKDNKNLKNLNRRDGIGCTLLFWVVYTEDIERVKYLLSIGAFPNISNYFGETPLHIAVMKNNKIIVNELLQYGAEINIENIYGETPRFYAYRNKNSDEIIKILESIEGIKNNPNIMNIKCTLLRKEKKKIDELEEDSSKLKGSSSENIIYRIIDIYGFTSVLTDEEKKQI